MGLSRRAVKPSRTEPPSCGPQGDGGVGALRPRGTTPAPSYGTTVMWLGTGGVIDGFAAK
ncbi:hypothetical protein GCM10010517_49940 [Streptosporangium fragile]|uniref:Uncharacterized protein n=1 Tax=Streptosporangium fragile TaxID=46186 RepID=A0ABN3W1V1_9ACTN